MLNKRLLFAVLMGAVVGCNSATASEGRQTVGRRTDDTPWVPEFGTLSVSSVGVTTASMRVQVVGGLYMARGVTSGDAVHVQVRRVAATSGFLSLTSGTLVAEDTGTGQVDVALQTSLVGYRYLVVAIPQESGVEYPDRAHFVEYVY